MINVAHSQHRRRVLQLSYACSPARGSEAGAGWHRAVQSAKQFDTWVLCEEHEFAGEIRQYLETHDEIPGLHFVFVPIDQREWSWGQINDIVWYTVLRRWHRRAFQVARRLHAQIGFDLVHQITFCGYREPGYLWKLDAPFVWGPIGGVQNYPWRFFCHAGLRGALKETCRTVVNNLQLRLSSRVRQAAKKAAVVIAANSTNGRRFSHVHKIALPVLSDVCIDHVGDAPRGEPHRGPIRLLWSGLLDHRKALHLLIEALAHLPDDVPFELRVLGEGPLKKRWQKLAKKRGVAKHITWMGWLPHREAVKQYAWADAFVFSSLRDTTGTVVVEALGAGLPVICLDHQGMHDVVTDDCGLKIPVTTPKKVMAGLSAAVERLARDETVRERLGRGAVERARQYLWSSQEELMASFYHQALGDKQCCFSAEKHRSKEKQIEPTMHTQQAHSFGILMYHRVADRVPGLPSPTWNVTPERFRRQLEGLLSRGYRPWPLRRALEHHNAGEPIPARTFVVTFDDGYDNVYHHAWPILKELSVPATVFVTTAYLDGDQPFAFDDWTSKGSPNAAAVSWQPLSTAHCIEMLKHGLVDIGSHTHTHADLHDRPAMFRHDLLRSLEVLRKKLGLTGTTFAFPYGYFSPDLVAVTRDSGVICALTTEAEVVVPQTDPFTWGRFHVDQYDTAVTLALKLNGWYTSLRDVWRRLRPSRTDRMRSASKARRPRLVDKRVTTSEIGHSP